MKISIITVCYNEEQNIASTLRSVLHQTSTDYEYIVCDGGSTDATYEIVEKYGEKFRKKGIHFYSQSTKDGGIYYGMNNAIAQATGDYCIFINGGDKLHDRHVLRKCIPLLTEEDPDVLYGSCIHFSGFKKKRIATDYRTILCGISISHQSSFIRTSHLKERNYRTDYRLASDYEYWWYLLWKGCRYVHTDWVISDFRLGGASEQNLSRNQAEVASILDEYHVLNMKLQQDLLNTRTSEETSDFYSYSFDNGLGNLGQGWSWPEPDKGGVWSVGNHAEFFFNLRTKKNVFCRLVFKDNFGYANDFYCNGHFIKTLDCTKETQTIRIPEEMIVEGINTFSIETKDAVAPVIAFCPEYAERRELNLFLQSSEILYDENLKDSVPDGYRKGWTLSHRGITMALGNRSDYTFAMDTPEDLTLRFRIVHTNGYHNGIYINGSFVAELQDKTGIHAISVPKDCLLPGENTVSFRTEDTVLPLKRVIRNRDDSRPCNFLLSDMQIIPASEMSYKACIRPGMVLYEAETGEHTNAAP